MIKITETLYLCFVFHSKYITFFEALVFIVDIHIGIRSIYLRNLRPLSLESEATRIETMERRF